MEPVQAGPCDACAKPGAQLRCAGCLVFRYCDQACQKQHWKQGGHKKACASKWAPPETGSGAGATGCGEPAHPCPICFEHEDDYDASAQERGSLCFVCGQKICGACTVAHMKSVRARGGAAVTRRDDYQCPTCRAPMACAPEESYANLRRLLRTRAPGRHTARAQADLGSKHARGDGTPVNAAEALRWFRLAAKAGDAAAQFNLGVAYNKGHGVARSMTEATRWLRLAADQGFLDAVSLLGHLRATGATAGEGAARAQQDGAEAAQLLGLAAAKADAEAQYSLGVLHREGKRAPQNLAEAAKWFRLAAEQGGLRAVCCAASAPMALPCVCLTRPVFARAPCLLFLCMFSCARVPFWRRGCF